MTYDRPQEWQPPRGSLIDEDQGWEPPEGSLLPVEEEERQPSLWERIAATNQVMSPVEQLSAAYRGK